MSSISLDFQLGLMIGVGLNFQKLLVGSRVVMPFSIPTSSIRKFSWLPILHDLPHFPISLQIGYFCSPDCMARKHDFPNCS